MDFNTAELSTPCNVCTPWRYSRQDSTLRRWDYTQLRWERIATEDQILSISNDTLFLTNGGFVLLPGASDLTGIRDTLEEVYDIIMNGDTNTANVLRVFLPTSILTTYGADPKAPRDSIIGEIAQAYQLAGQARPGSIFVSQVPATTTNPSHQAASLESSTPFNAWFWDGLRVTRISYGKIAVNLEDTLAGGLNNIPIEPAPDATYASVRKFIDDNHGVLSMPNGTLLYWVGDGSVVSPDTIWVILDNVSDTTRITLLKTKPSSTVELALPTEFNVVNDPDLLSASWVAQSPNRVLAGPVSGAASAPTFRAMVVNDLPDSGVTADTYASPSSVTVNAKGQVTAITAGASDTIFVSLIHTDVGEANLNNVDGEGFVVPASLNGAQIVGAAYRSVTDVGSGDLSVAINKNTTVGTSANALSTTIVLGGRYAETTGSMTINTGDFVRVWNDTSGDTSGLFATIKIVR